METIDKMDAIFKKLPQIEGECDRCFGRGNVFYHARRGVRTYDNLTRDCPRCNGTGVAVRDMKDREAMEFLFGLISRVEYRTRKRNPNSGRR